MDDARTISCSPELLQALISEMKKQKEKCMECKIGCEAFREVCILMKYKELVERATGNTIQEIIN